MAAAHTAPARTPRYGALQICQNKIIWNLFQDKLNYNSTTDLFHQLGILKVKDNNNFEASKAIYKALHTNKFQPLRRLLDGLGWTHEYQTRGIHAFRLPQVRSALERRDFLFYSVFYWNSIPREIRDTASLYAFKKSLRVRLMLQYN